MKRFNKRWEHTRQGVRGTMQPSSKPAHLGWRTRPPAAQPRPAPRCKGGKHTLRFQGVAVGSCVFSHYTGALSLHVARPLGHTCEPCRKHNSRAPLPRELTCTAPRSAAGWPWPFRAPGSRRSCQWMVAAAKNGCWLPSREAHARAMPTTQSMPLSTHV